MTKAGGTLEARAFTHALTKYLSWTPHPCVVSIAEGQGHRVQGHRACVLAGCHVRGGGFSMIKEACGVVKRTMYATYCSISSEHKNGPSQGHQ